MNVDAIPSTLKQQDRWLLWDSSYHTPRQPHWRGDFKEISWSDPNDWHSFEEAVEASREKDSWGIGFVFEPDDEIYAVDIDGPYNNDGEPREWFPGREPFEATYMEWSPSGEGIHAIVEGEPPEWWSDCEADIEWWRERGTDPVERGWIDDPEEENLHQGVDVLQNKFCTVTGDRIAGSSKQVALVDADSWFTQVYHTIRGELPGEDRGSNTDSQPKPDLSAEEVEAALDNINPDLSHSEWVRLGFAVYDWDEGQDGKEIFKKWSQGGAKYDTDAKRTIDWIWTHAEQDDPESAKDNVSVGTLIHHAKNNGWRPPSKSLGANDKTTWDDIKDEFKDGNAGYGRKLAADWLEQAHDWMYVMESEVLWHYDHDTGYFVPWGEELAARILEGELGGHYSQRTRNNVVDRLQQRNQVHRSSINAAEEADPLVCVGNGVVNLATGEKRDHDPKYKFIRGIEWDYAPDRADTEPVLSFLDDITKREADRDTLLDHLAHGLMPGHPFRAFVMMYGPGSNGKTKVGELFRAFVGETNAAAVELQDLTGNDDFATGALPGAFINVGDDVTIGEIRDASTLKSLTGGATMRANEKFEKKFDFKNEAAMFFSANEPPRITEVTEAIGDRLYPIEMPYRFLDAGRMDPDDPTHKKMDPNIADRLKDDDEAMRGLLVLAVEHGRRLIESGGQYAMPEGPAERRKMYEAASDPIHRFAYEYLEPGDGDDALLKDDVYSVYKRMCEIQDERTAKEDVFKEQVTKQNIVDVESARVRALTPGDDREPAWRYVQFADDAREFMPDRVADRYLEIEAKATADVDGSAFDARPLQSVAESPTGYATVTAEVVEVEPSDGDRPAKAVLRDKSGAMDMVSWDDDVAARLSKHEGQALAIKNADVGEYDGQKQLEAKPNLTTFQEIQPGVGHTEGQATADGQNDLTAAVDGGELESLKQRVVKELSQYDSGDQFGVAEVAGSVGADPDAVRDRLAIIKTETSLIQSLDDGYEKL